MFLAKPIFNFTKRNSNNFHKFNNVQRVFPVANMPLIPLRNLFIQIQKTPNENAKKFIPTGGEFKLNIEDTLQFDKFKSTSTSPLAKELLQLEGIESVLLGKDFISVNKDEETKWESLTPTILSTLTDFYFSGEDAVTTNQEITDTSILPGDSEVVIQIKEILENRVRPSVQDDGGDIEYKGYFGSIVVVKLKGSCVGCSSSSITLKNGIERVLMHYIPEITKVVAIENDEELSEYVNTN